MIWIENRFRATKKRWISYPLLPVGNRLITLLPHSYGR